MDARTQDHSAGFRASSSMRRLQVDDAEIEYEVIGAGEPVLLIHPSLFADGLAFPLFSQPELAAEYQLIHYHRRGYAGSTRGSAPLSTERQVADAASLLAHLGTGRAHVAGYSYGAVIAIRLALAEPGRIHSLALLEPPARMILGAKASLQRDFLPIMDAYRAGKRLTALELFCEFYFGPHWRPVVEQAIPGGAEQALRDLDTFMLEGPAIQAWNVEAREAASFTRPLLYMVGVQSVEFQDEGRRLFHSWFPQAQDLDVNASHALPMEDPKTVARGLAEFFARHPMR